MVTRSSRNLHNCIWLNNSFQLDNVERVGDAHATSDAFQHYKRSCFEFYDQLVSNLKERFHQNCVDTNGHREFNDVWYSQRWAFAHVWARKHAEKWRHAMHEQRIKHWITETLIFEHSQTIQIRVYYEIEMI